MRKPSETSPTEATAGTCALSSGTNAAQPPGVALVLGDDAGREGGVTADTALGGGRFVIRHAASPADMSTVDDASQVFAVVIEGTGRLRRHLASTAAAAAEAFPTARLLLAVEEEDLDSEAVSDLVADGVAHLVAPLPVTLADLTADLHRLWLLWRIDGSTDPTASVPAAGTSDGGPLMVGEGAAMREAFARIRRFAATDVPVLVTGESGTGKELVARAIHERSAVADGPFVAINCGGIPADLVAAELFGHEKGAFTGAHQRRPGRIEMADGGTLFLDEIGDFPMHLQPHLLRFLQEGTFERVGGLDTLRITTRIIAATNVDLEKAVEAGRFRRDLFFRLNVLRLHLPPLRERGDDVTLLARYYIDRLRHAHGKPLARLTPEALVAVRNHPWPGNVRQLISALRRGLTLCRRGRITPADMGLADEPGSKDDGPPPSLDAARAAAEKAAVLAAMRHARNRPSGAAEVLGISRVTLYSLMKKHDLARRFEIKTRK